MAERIEACSQDVDAWDLAYATLSLGGLLYEAGQDERAEKEFSTSLEYFEVTEEKLQGVIWARHKLALLRQQKGEFKKANEGMMEALAAAGQLNDLHVTVLCLDDAVPLVSKQIADKTSVGGSGQEKLAMVLGAVDQWREMLSLRRSPREKSAYRRVTKRLQRVMEESTYLSARQKGQSLTVERVVHEVSELLETFNKSESKESQPVEIEGKYGKLTNREHQVIGLIAEGLSNQEIGEHLFITERTVRAHVTSIYNKLGADNRAQAVAIASRLGIL